MLPHSREFAVKSAFLVSFISNFQLKFGRLHMLPCDNLCVAKAREIQIFGVPMQNRSLSPKLRPTNATIVVGEVTCKNSEATNSKSQSLIWFPCTSLFTNVSVTTLPSIDTLHSVTSHRRNSSCDGAPSQTKRHGHRRKERHRVTHRRSVPVRRTGSNRPSLDNALRPSWRPRDGVRVIHFVVQLTTPVRGICLSFRVTFSKIEYVLITWPTEQHGELKAKNG